MRAALGPAALHPPAAKQHRDATLDAHPKTLPLFEGPAALQGFLLRRLLSAALGDAYLAHAGLLTVVHIVGTRSEEHTSELQSLRHLVCRLLLEKKFRGDRPLRDD